MKATEIAGRGLPRRQAAAGRLGRLRAGGLAARELDDAPLAAHLAALHDAGRDAASAAMAVGAACFRAKLAGRPRQRADRQGDRRLPADCRRSGTGQARPFGVSNLVAVLATCHRPRRRGRWRRGPTGSPSSAGVSTR